MKISLLFLVLIGAAGLIAAGCGDSGGPDMKVEETRVGKATEMRRLFDKSGGDYSKLDATDKATIDKLAGSSEEAQKSFSEMKTGPSVGSAPPQ